VSKDTKNLEKYILQHSTPSAALFACLYV